MQVAPPAAKLLFTGVGDRDVYNITAPFQYAGQVTIAGRVEKRDEEFAEIVFFREGDAGWVPLNDGPRFSGLQDPCITTIDGSLLLGGVRFPSSVGDEENTWHMEFFHEAEDGSLRHALTGPPGMKDIRFVQLPDGSVLGFSRPQGEKGGRGKIGFFVAESLASVTAAVIDDAPLLEGLCADDEWVGANEAHVLGPGQIGVLGHLARFSDDQKRRHYYAMAFRLNIATGECTPPEIIARRSDFPPGAAKRPDLVDVIFAGGLQRLANGRARLYAGLSDAEAGYVDLADPFGKLDGGGLTW